MTFKADDEKRKFLERMGRLDDAVAKEGVRYVLPISNKEEARKEMREFIRRDKEKQLVWHHD